MGFAFVMFLAVFLLIASGGLILFYREAMLERISEVINPKPKKTSLMTAIQESGFSIGGAVEHFESFLPKSQAEQSIVRQRLIRAGYRNESAMKTFYGTKVVLPLALCAIATVTGATHYVGSFFLYILCLGVGFLAPDFWLGNRIKKRQGKIGRGLPDVLDLLVICIEAGLSIDQATVRASEELKLAQPQLCDELTVVVLEQRAGRPRSEAWKHLAERTGEENCRNLVSMLVQAEQFGTSLAKTLRIHSDTLRTKRMQQVEEAASKTTIKLLFPLVLFIFPALFLVVLGPAVIMMMENFATLFGPK
jgi:tight adherence protein C